MVPFPELISRATRVRATILALFLSAGCTKDSVRQFVDVSSLDYDLGFVVLVDAQGNIVDTTEPHAYEDGALSFGTRPELPIESGQRLILALVSETGLRGSSEAYEPSRKSEIRVAIDPEAMTCASGRLVDEGRKLQVPLPTDTRLLEIDAESGELAPLATESFMPFAQLRLEMGVPDRGCGDLPPSFEPFFSDPEAITREIGPISAYGILRLDDDRVLLVSGEKLALLDRQSTPSVSVLLTFPGYSGKIIATPLRLPVARGVLVPLLIGTARVDAARRETMHTFDVVYDGDRGATLTRTATLGSGRLRELAINEEGWTVLVAENSALYARGPNETAFSAQAFADGPTRYAVVPGEGGRFWVGGDNGLLYEGHPSTGIWERVEVRHDLALGMRMRAILPPRNGSELWVGGSRGRLLRRDRNLEWHSIAPAMPRAFAACERGDSLICGGLDQLNAVEEIFVIPRGEGRDPLHLLLIAQCSAAIVVTGDERCPGVLSFAERPIEGLENISLVVNHVLPGRWLTLANEASDTMIYELDLSRLDAR